MNMSLNCREIRRESGAILVVALVLSIAVAMIIASAVQNSQALGRQAQFELDRTASQALADGVTEIVQKDMLDKVANFKTFELTGAVPLQGEDYPYLITPIGSESVRTDTDGVSMAVQAYQISCTVDMDRGGATVNRIVELTMTPLFQYMIFYKGDLEILPGPNMILEGRVHSNRDIYVGAGATLTVATDYFRSTGEILRKRKNNGTTSGGTINIKVHQQSTYETMGTSEDSSNSDWLTLSDKWKGTVQSGAHGVKAVEAPSVGTIKAFDPVTGEKGYYHANADLVIVDDQAYVDGSSSPTPLPPGTIVERTMYDGREGKNITVTDIDMGLLNSSGLFPTNGVIYAYRTDASAAQPNGIRLSNASELAAPLTVISEDPVFVKGDYNTVNKKASAVIADAVNLLSNSWNDSKTSGTLPKASATTYNLAMITGTVPTPDGGGNYSGGFENLPRFHEAWSGVPATIRGAFANIFDSEIGKGNWRYGGDVYKAPIRDWRFDPDLLTNQPPLSPNAVYFQRVLWDDNLAHPW